MTNQSGGSGGSYTLAGDTDVTISNPADKQALVYNGAVWVNQAGGQRRYQSTLLAAPQASIAIPATIPAGYSAILLELTARGDVSATFSSLNLQFNGDTGANYDTQTLVGNGGTPSAGQTLAGTAYQAGYAAGATSPAGVASTTSIRIPNYSQTTFRKQIFSQSFLKAADTSANMFATLLYGEWRNTAAITSILVTLTTGNFIAGTILTAWLVP